jgi:hypothetical protein
MRKIVVAFATSVGIGAVTSKTLLAALAIAFAAPALSGTAHANGFLADTFIRPFSPSAADAADRAHAALGKPLDHAANGAAGAVVGTVTGNPAAGAATTVILEGHTNGQY